MTRKLVLALMLSCVVLPVAARDVQMLSPNGGGGDCPIVQDDETETDNGKVAGKRAGSAAKAKAPARRGADTEAAVRPPRWHSFLPGMFR